MSAAARRVALVLLAAPLMAAATYAPAAQAYGADDFPGPYRSPAAAATHPAPAPSGGAVAAHPAPAAAAHPAPLAPAMGIDDARHLLGRAGFGGTPHEIAKFARLTRAQAVAKLLQNIPVEAGTPPPAWTREATWSPRAIREASPEERRAWVEEQARRVLELRGWWVGEMIATRAPLAERMTLFWHNHFVSSQQKVRNTASLYQQNLLLRRHALGNFGDMVHAIAKDPAMIVYLDTATNRRDRPNENFARELMELFVLGEGFYSETDIREAARAFTGWGLDPETGEFRFRRMVHDDGVKTVLGRSGAFDGDEVIGVLLEQPIVAEHVVKKLWREFVSPEPDPSEVSRIASKFRAADYSIAVAVRELLLSRAFWAKEARAALIKSPVDLVVGAVRQFEIDVPDPTPLAVAAAQLGQVLFAPPNVKGWPGGEAWINSTTLLARKQFLERLFRADEMARPGGGARIAVAEGLRNGVPAAPAMARAEIRRAFEAIYFDDQRWLAELKTIEGLAPRRAVLAVDAVGPMPAEFAGRRQLKQLVLDPSFQLK